MNSVNLIGRLARDPEYRTTDNGKGFCNFTIAVRNPYREDNQADFINCVAWGKIGELVAEHHVKGNLIGIDGRIQTRSYEHPETEQMIYVTEVNVSNIHFIQANFEESEKPKNSSANKNNKGKPKYKK